MDEQIMIKYIQGRCSSEEKASFLEWLGQSEENRKLFFETKALLNYRNVKYFASEEQVSRSLQELNRRIDNHAIPQAKKLYFRIARYAAIIIVAMALPFVLKLTYNQLTTESVTVATNQTDSCKIIALGDGSKVWLNNNSKLTYSKKFGRNERYVTFIGEAYFEIKHDPQHPFIVQTQNVQVKVLGTSFNLRAYPSEKKTETTLVNGKVTVQNKKGENLAILAPGQMAEYDKTNHNLSIKEVDTDLYTSWRNGIIMFTNATLDEITSKLSGIYQINFVFGTPHNDKTTYNFNFNKNQPIDKVMEMLSFIAPIDYQIKEKEVIVTQQ